MWIVCCNIATEKWLGGTPLERPLWGEITPVPPFLTGLDKACFSILGWPGFLCEFHRQTGVKNHRHTAGFSLFFGRPNSWFSKSGRAQFGNPLVSPIRVIAYRNPRTLLEK
jgi:hypothetical protein